ncbi:MAG TPA: Uma2 family endonuclease [Thermoanaerobaculia bacterium]|nr:Uma2 family endonuclease [Thermoanaerobaculia bacterium]
MARRHAIIAEENLRIPQEASTLEGFQRWAQSEEFPENGRIDYLSGEIAVAMSPEDLHTHGIVKAAIHAALHLLVAGRLGETYVDRARVTSRFAKLSVEPDVVVVLWDSLKSGRVRYVPAAVREADRFSEIEGAPDVVVEVVSDGSERKDTKRLPPLYAQAGIPELWITDTRKGRIRFQIHTLQDGRYVAVEADGDGWMQSPRLGLAFRLIRQKTPVSTWHYILEHREA